jgi:hypothetical protein
VVATPFDAPQRFGLEEATSLLETLARTASIQAVFQAGSRSPNRLFKPRLRPQIGKPLTCRAISSR